MKIKTLHYFSGIIFTGFVGLHLVNHGYSLGGAQSHIQYMDHIRPLYRNVWVETALLGAVLVQIITGIALFRENKDKTASFFEWLQVWTGFYLAIFLLIHVSAVYVGRWVLQLDTNFYFGVVGLNHFPSNIFFIPYYSMAVLSFFGHIASIHSKKMKYNLLGINPTIQCKFILFFGVLYTVVLLYGFTNGGKGVPIPPAYHILIGK